MKQSIKLEFDYQNKHYKLEAIPASPKRFNASFPAFDIFLDNEYNGTIVKINNGWKSDNHFDNDLVSTIGILLIT